MRDFKGLRQQLVNLLTKNQAHMSFSDTLADFPMGKINTIFPNGEYSAWHLLEHIRRTQNDILEFIVSNNYTEKAWPKDYWPKKAENASPKEWSRTIAVFLKDRNKLVELVKDPEMDLFSRLRNGDGQTLLKEILVVADHTAYHVGEFAIMRQVMRTWKK
jgi:hypothetical protein